MNARRDLTYWLLIAGGGVGAANAVWLLVAPLSWYHGLPADVPDTGPYNEHFVRDIGTAFATMAVAFDWAAVAPRWRAPLVTIVTIFFTAHAALHVFDTARGFLDAHHWLLDAPAVYLPPVVLVPFAWRTLRRAAQTA